MDVERGLRELEWTEPPADLRGRVLSAAFVPPRPVTWSDRIWFSRTWRMAALATIAIALGLELQPGVNDADRVVAPRSAAEAQAIDDGVRAMNLPPQFAAALAQRALRPQAVPVEERR